VIGASPFTDTNRQSNTVRPDCRFAALKGSTELARVISELPASNQQIDHDRTTRI
jgi:hypothetical protein